MSKLTFTTSTLPVSKKLHKLISERFTAHLLSNEALTTSRYLVFNFRDKNYSAEEGGFHPVEMAICQTSTGNGVLSTSLTLLIWAPTTQARAQLGF